MGCCTREKVAICATVLGAILIILGGVIGFVVLPNVVEDQIKKNVELKEGTEQYDRWKELPFPLTFKVYIFEVNNTEEVLAGMKPKVQEKGPWVYKQYRNKQNIEYTEETDILRYQQNLEFVFSPEESNGHTEEDEVTVLNMPLYGVLQILEGFSLVNVDETWPIMFQTNTLFHTIKVKDFLFDGYKFCDPQFVGSVLYPEWLLCIGVRLTTLSSKTLSVTNPDELLSSTVQFSFFNHKNFTHDGWYEIFAGTKDVHQLGAIQRWEDKERLDTWDREFSTCNDVRGRDSSIYPPFNNDSSRFDVFNTDICRIVQLTNDGTGTYQDIDGIRLIMKDDNLSNRGSQSCYCIKQTKTLNGTLECLPEGFGDAYNCVKAPVIISFPHFLGTNSSYKDTVEGLSPNEDKHRTFVLIEPGTGSPLKGAKRLQFNMGLRPIEQIAITQPLQPSLLPIIWVEEGVEITDDLVQQLKDDYLSQLVLVDALTWTMIGLGIALFAGGVVYLGYRKICR